MQEEMTQQSLILSFKAVELTADLLYTALKTLLEDGGKHHGKGYGSITTCVLLVMVELNPTV